MISGADHIQIRSAEFRRNPRLEQALAKLNGCLAEAEHAATADFSEPQLPHVFLLGNARSGTTLALGWLAASGVFAYPTNLLSRFSRAPFIGALIQQILTDPSFDFRGELGEFQQPTDFFSSTMGKTKGVLAPHEFWYFWRRFCPGDELRPIEESAVSGETIRELQREVAALESLSGRPLAWKAMHMNFNVPFFARLFPRAIFVHLRRDPLFNIQSLLEARVRQFGNLEAWYSVKPPEYEALAALDPIAQVAGQVFHVNRHIACGLAEIRSRQALTLDYEALCADPRAAFEQLLAKMREGGWDAPAEYRGPAAFKPGNHLRLAEAQLARARAAWRQFSGEELGT